MIDALKRARDVGAIDYALFSELADAARRNGHLNANDLARLPLYQITARVRAEQSKATGDKATVHNDPQQAALAQVITTAMENGGETTAFAWVFMANLALMTEGMGGSRRNEYEDEREINKLMGGLVDAQEVSGERGVRVSTPADERPLGAFATELVQAFSFNGGTPALSEEKLAHWTERCITDVPEREETARDLIAFASRLSREQPGGSRVAISQLIGLAGLILLDVQAALQAARSAGLELDAAAVERVIGIGSSKIPVGAGGKQPGSSSPLETRFKK